MVFNREMGKWKQAAKVLRQEGARSIPEIYSQCVWSSETFGEDETGATAELPQPAKNLAWEDGVPMNNFNKERTLCFLTGRGNVAIFCP